MFCHYCKVGLSISATAGSLVWATQQTCAAARGGFPLGSGLQDGTTRGNSVRASLRTCGGGIGYGTSTRVYSWEEYTFVVSTTTLHCDGTLRKVFDLKSTLWQLPLAIRCAAYQCHTNIAVGNHVPTGWLSCLPVTESPPTTPVTAGL